MRRSESDSAKNFALGALMGGGLAVGINNIRACSTQISLMLISMDMED